MAISTPSSSRKRNGKRSWKCYFTFSQTFLLLIITLTLLLLLSSYYALGGISPSSPFIAPPLLNYDINDISPLQNDNEVRENDTKESSITTTVIDNNIINTTYRRQQSKNGGTTLESSIRKIQKQQQHQKLRSENNNENSSNSSGIDGSTDTKISIVQKQQQPHNGNGNFGNASSWHLPITKNDDNGDKVKLPPLWFYFIHVGKTGGQTIQELLPIPFRKRKAVACLMKYPNVTMGLQKQHECYTPNQDESQLSRRTVSHFHLSMFRIPRKEQKWVLDNTNAFLVPIRDPIDRLVSAFWYHKKEGRPHNDEVYSCFTDVQNMVEIVSNTTTHDDVNTTKCRTLGLHAFEGNKGDVLLQHMGFNYQYYEDNSLKRKPDNFVAVIRTDHLWNDTSALDLALGGTGQFNNTGKKYSHGSEKYKYNTTLSPQATKDLCCLISNEMASYQRFVLKAFNLDKYQKYETLMGVLHHCHIQYEKDPVDFPFSWEAFYNQTCATIEGRKRYARSFS